MIASAKAAWGVAGIMAVALAGVGYQYASRSGNLSEQTASFENEQAETLEARLRDRESEFGQSQKRDPTDRSKRKPRHSRLGSGIANPSSVRASARLRSGRRRRGARRIVFGPHCGTRTAFCPNSEMP